MAELRPIETTLVERVAGFITAIRETRDDSEALDRMAVRHIVENTFAPFQVFQNTSRSNFLVPLEVANSRNYLAWRFAPYISVELPLLKSVSKVRIQLDFSIPSYVSYAERKEKKLVKRVSVKPPVPPQDFFIVSTKESIEGVCEKSILIEDKVQPKSLSLKHFSWEDTLPLSRITKGYTNSLGVETMENVIKEFPSTNLFSDQDSNLDRVDILRETSGAVQLEFKLSILPKSILRKYETLSVELVNVTPVGTQNQRSRNAWRQNCIIFPTLQIEFDKPQNYPTIETLTKQTDHDLSEEREQILQEIKEGAPRATNAIVNLVPGPEGRTLVGMTSIHDTPLLLPVPGPQLDDLLKEKGIEKNLSEFNSNEFTVLRESGKIEVLKKLVEVIQLTFPHIQTLHKFQWIAIQRRMKLLLTEEFSGTCHLIKAPTGTGKTLVFMADAILHYVLTRERVGIAFPTRILNEDMYRRLTKFIHNARKVYKMIDITGGLLIGTRDPLYQSINAPDAGQLMVQYDTCPECGSKGTIYARARGNRIVGVCANEECKHEIDYMFGSTESMDYLPAVTIATPDKLFYEATARPSSEVYPMRLFGGRYRKCSDCGYLIPYTIFDTGKCPKCDSTNVEIIQRNPILFWIFDEVHSLYGLTGTLLSVFLASLQTYWKRVLKGNIEELSPETIFSYEVGTATVSNEKSLISELFRVDDDRIHIIPDSHGYTSTFHTEPRKTRYRILVNMPIAESLSRLASNDMLVSRKALFDTDTFQKGLAENLGLSKNTAPYDMSLTYVQRKDMGNTLVRDYMYKSRTEYEKSDPIPFISGDTSTAYLAEYFKRASSGALKTVVANVVISLGLDIERLNHMIVVGIPESITEFVQTIGRTGRRPGIPGFIHVLVRPDYPRDLEFYREFQYILGDIKGYFDSKAIKRTSIYAARKIFPNILRITLTGLSENERNYMMTVPQASSKLTTFPVLKAAVLKDIAMSICGSNHPQRMLYLRVANEELEKILNSWRRVTGRGKYVGTTLNAEQLLLFTLRDSEQRDIPVEPTDALASVLERERHIALKLIEENEGETQNEN